MHTIFDTKDAFGNVLPSFLSNEPVDFFSKSRFIAVSNSRLDMQSFNYAQRTLLLRELIKIVESENKILNRTLQNTFLWWNVAHVWMKRSIKLSY